MFNVTTVFVPQRAGEGAPVPEERKEAARTTAEDSGNPLFTEN